MAKYITPTLTITSNKHDASTNPGPTSSPIAISVTDTLDVTKVHSEIVDVDASHGATNMLFDASDYGASMTEGVDGGFVFLKNLLSDNSPEDRNHDIMIGATTGELDSDADPTSPSAVRLMTLKPGEFAWMPWDMTFDLYYDAKETNTEALEAILFVRTGTA